MTDWKCKVKAKAAKIRAGQVQTGGGEPICPPLTTIEERLLALMGEKGLTGDNVKELGIESVNNLAMSIVNRTNYIKFF